MSHQRRPTEAERDELVRLDDSGISWTLEEAARVLLAVKPSDIDDDARKAEE